MITSRLEPTLDGFTDQNLDEYPYYVIQNNTVYLKHPNPISITYSQETNLFEVTHCVICDNIFNFEDKFLCFPNKTLKYFIIVSYNNGLKAINLPSMISNDIISYVPYFIPFSGDPVRMTNREVKKKIFLAGNYLNFKNSYNLHIIGIYLINFSYTLSKFPLYNNEDTETILEKIDDFPHSPIPEYGLTYKLTDNIYINSNTVYEIYETLGIMINTEMCKFSQMSRHSSNRTRKIKNGYYLSKEDFDKAAAELRIYRGKMAFEVLTNRTTRVKSARVFSS